MPSRDLRAPRRSEKTWGSMAQITPEDVESAKEAGRRRVRDEFKNLADATIDEPES